MQASVAEEFDDFSKGLTKSLDKCDVSKELNPSMAAEQMAVSDMVFSNWTGNTTTDEEYTVVRASVMPGLLSDRARQIFIIVNHVVLSTAIGLFGVGANVINMVVFVKQGLNNSMNISFFAMAVSDLCSLITLLWLNVCLNPYLDNIDSPIVFIEVQYLTAGWPHGCAARITSWITAYITAERCLSIVLPLKVKRIVTPRRTAVILIFIYIINILTLVPEYSTAYFAWNSYPGKNHTMLGLAFRSNRPVTEGLVFTFHAAFAIFSFTANVIFTSILVARLKSVAKWRRKSTFDNEQSENMAARDKKTMTMIILVAIILIICYTPTVVFSIVSTSVPEFSVVGRQSNIFHAAWSFAFLTHSINSSINIFLYYSMSSKYRNNFLRLFSACRKTSGNAGLKREDNSKVDSTNTNQTEIVLQDVPD